ncbi:MAG: hypothetical protein FJW20_23240 [Acidimicrobiia bacterium]|nr:hypothetical protein [Acidimicrobiia bacterium]
MRGFVFRWQRYRVVSEAWDHDHCSGCWAKFSEFPEQYSEPIQTEGWVTLWPTEDEPEPELIVKARTSGWRVEPSPKYGGFQLNWVCKECYELFGAGLDFVADAQHPQWGLAGI